MRIDAHQQDHHAAIVCHRPDFARASHDLRYLADRRDVRAEIAAQGRTFNSETDTEVIAHLVATARGPSLVDRVRAAHARIAAA